MDGALVGGRREGQAEWLATKSEPLVLFVDRSKAKLTRVGNSDSVRFSDNDTLEVFAAEEGSSVNGNRGEDFITSSISGVIDRRGKDNDTLAVSQGEA